VDEISTPARDDISNIYIVNKVDNDFDNYNQDFDLEVHADTRLTDADRLSPGDPKFEVRINGLSIKEVKVPRESNLVRRINVSRSLLRRTFDRETLTVTVVLWDDDVQDDDKIAERSRSVKYEPRPDLSIDVSRTETVTGAPVSLRAIGGSGRYEWAVVNAPEEADDTVHSPNQQSTTFRPTSGGEYTLKASDTELEVSRTVTINVSQRSDLIDRYAPIVHFSAAEQYRPTRYEAFLRRSTLERDGTIVTANPTVFDLESLGEEYDLELNGDEASFPSYDDVYPPTVYASVHPNTEFQGQHYTAVSYWFFYIYDSKDGSLLDIGEHMSDLESITILINESGAQWISASQHYGGERREWKKSPRNETHPHVYPAVGAHSMFLRNTDRYAGNGFLPQSQFILEDGGDSSILPQLYTDTTGSDDVWKPAEHDGVNYELVPLTGNERWASFEGSFSPGTDGGQIPMERRRWDSPGEWTRDEVLADESQVRGTIQQSDATTSAQRLTVTNTIKNTGPKPHRFWTLIEAKPDDKPWDGAHTELLTADPVHIGTGSTETIVSNGTLTGLSPGMWDTRTKLSAYHPNKSEPEDVLAITPLRLFDVTNTTITVDDATGDPGRNVSVNITTNAENVGAYQTNLSFNPNLMRLVAINGGSFDSPDFTISRSDGWISLTGSNPVGTDQPTLAQLTFRLTDDLAGLKEPIRLKDEQTSLRDEDGEKISIREARDGHIRANRFQTDLTVTTNQTSLRIGDHVRFSTTESDSGEAVNASLEFNDRTLRTGPDGSVTVEVETVGIVKVVASKVATTRRVYLNDTLEIEITEDDPAVGCAIASRSKPTDQISLREMQQAIGWWKINKSVPGTEGPVLTLTEIQNLVDKWKHDYRFPC
jgi:hypothetical protein